MTTKIKPNILVVDDLPANILAMQKVLHELDANIVTASSGNEALSHLLRTQFAVILLDVQMPDMDGFETASLIAEIEEARHTPIIFVTAIEKEERYAFKGYELGAVDYLFKPIDAHVLISKVKIFLQLYEQKHKLEQNALELKGLLSKKSELLNTIEEQSKQKDTMLVQINRQNTKLRNYSKLWITVAILTVITSAALVYNIYTKHTLAKLNTLNLAYMRFVPHEFLRLLGKGSIVDVHLGDQRQKDMVVMFTDVRNYTGITEHLTPQENIELTNKIFSIQLPAIYNNNGIINKYLGDGLMALFPGGADDAVNCGIEMLKGLRAFSDERQKLGLPAIRIGIGLDGGEIMLGTVGIEAHMEQTVVADSVNVASRIESLNKMYRTTMLMSGNVHKRLKNPDKYIIRLMDEVTVLGRQRAIPIYQVFDGESEEVIALGKETMGTFGEGVALFRDRKFSAAKKAFSEVVSINKDDVAAMTYLDRIKELRDKELPQHWSYVRALTVK